MNADGSELTLTQERSVVRDREESAVQGKQLVCVRELTRIRFELFSQKVETFK